MSYNLRRAVFAIALSGLWMGIPVCNVVRAATHYPPPFPREGAVKVLENCRIIVWDATWPKGQWSQMHKHYLDALIVTLRGGTVETVTLDGRKKTRTDKTGDVSWFGRGVIHKEVGLTNPPRHAIVIEFKPPRPQCRI